MSPKRRVSVSEFNNYSPAAGQANEGRIGEDENGNAFTFDKELEFSDSGAVEDLAVIDSVKARNILPDLLQPRPSPLPYAVRARFRRGELDAFQAAREWMRLAEKDAVLLHEITRYLNMGASIAENGQINPITGRWEEVAQRGRPRRIFRIETGEQRFWSAVLYHTQQRGDPDALELRVSVVPAAVAPTETAVIRRQITENRKNMQLTEVLQAREISRLLLAVISEKTGQTFLGDENDEYAFFRNILSVGRVPHGVWDTVQAEFGLGQHRMRQSLDILNLPSDLLDLAHKTRLSYRTLSQILRLPEEEWQAAVWEAAAQSIAAEQNDEDLPTPEESGTDGAERAASRRLKKPVDPAELAYRGVRRFYRSAIKGYHSNPLLIQAVADNVIMDGYAEEVIDFMEDLISAIRLRMNED